MSANPRDISTPHDQKRSIFMINIKKTHNFKSIEKEIDFWQTHNATDSIDCSNAQNATFPYLYPSTPITPEKARA
jgi:hypothetical protein